MQKKTPNSSLPMGRPFIVITGFQLAQESLKSKDFDRYVAFRSTLLLFATRRHTCEAGCYDSLSDHPVVRRLHSSPYISCPPIEAIPFQVGYLIIL